MNKNNSKTARGKTDPEDDYIFRFPIKRRNPSSDPDQVLVEFFKDQMRDLLKVIFLSQDGKRLMPTHFGFLHKPGEEYSLWQE
ncbi:MAG: hypothetical protein JRJ29_07685 [Deltaproteobacteria bacterium]|nr:hypothetical protein [Deltaproteobacteria bacterium]